MKSHPRRPRSIKWEKTGETTAGGGGATAVPGRREKGKPPVEERGGVDMTAAQQFRCRGEVRGTTTERRAASESEGKKVDREQETLTQAQRSKCGGEDRTLGGGGKVCVKHKLSPGK